MNIYLDECGYTGADLMNNEQPVFVIGSHNIEEKYCHELKSKYFSKVKAKELKHSLLCKRSSQQTMVIDFMKYIRSNPSNVKVSITHKKYALVCKIVEMIETLAHDEGIDLYEQGGNLAMANLFFYTFPVFGGKEFFERFLQSFQNMVRNKTRETYRDFFKPLFTKKYRDELDDMLVFIRAININYGLSYLNIIPDNYLDLAFTSSLNIMAMWRASFTGELRIIHDASTNMSKQKNIWDAVMDPNLKPTMVGYDRRKMTFPIAVKETVFEKSEIDVGLQLADIIAGCTTYAINWLIGGQNSSDDYGREIFNIIGDLPAHTVWPEDKVTPAELGTIGDNAQDPNDYLARIIKEIN
ncbi:MAG: DUF3800 domain-containing protein [Clostridia bacterium]|nr:DUF3800 domain-containing protein [Clostridia bacterium]